MVSPTFRDGRLVALFASTTHVVDIGGIGLSPDGRQVYHEGLFVPITPLMQGGRINEWLVNLIRHNVREPEQVEGDLYALVACNDTGSDRLLAMMEEYDLSALDALAEHIIESSGRAMRAAIDRLPEGSWTHAMRIDGYEVPIDLVAAVTVGGGAIDPEQPRLTGTHYRDCPPEHHCQRLTARSRGGALDHRAHAA